MFKKKTRRNFRQRKGESSSDEDEEKKRGDAGDAGGSQQQVHLPSSSRPPGRGIACSSKREEAPVRPDSSDPEDGEKRDEEPMTLSTEQSGKKDGQKKKGNAVLSFSEDKEVAEGPEFQLRKSSDKAVVFKKIKRKSHSTAIGGDGSKSVSSRLDSPCPIHEEEEDDEDDDDDGPATPYSSASSLSDTSVPEQVTAPTVIPDIKDIQAAKRIRRNARAQKEFLPLGMKEQNSPASSSDVHSREDEDEEDEEVDDSEKDDHERRIEFAPRTKSIRERITEKLEGSDDSGRDSSEREDQDVWEEMQIGKGVKRRPGEQSPSGSDSSWTGRQRRKTRSTAVHLPETLPPVSISTVMRRINAKLESLKEVHRARQAELRRMTGDAESSRISIEKLEEGSSEAQLKFFKKMNVYSQNLVECLQEKAMEINSLEVELHSLLSDHMEALVANRRQTVREEAGRLQQLTYGAAEQSGGGPSQREDAAEDAMCVDTPEDTQPSSEEEDELQRERVAVLQRAQSLFGDVEEEFSDVQKVLRAFEEWRDFHPDSYQNAYISLCLPKLLNPHIRHQILSWNPLTDSVGDVEALPWYGAVESFCLNQEHTDTQTFTNVVEKTLLPKITAYVELVWDPLSHRQSVCLSDVCHSLRDDFAVFQGEQSKPVKVFIQAVVSRLRSCVDEDIFIPLFPKPVLEDLTSPQCGFRDRQLWTAVKLLGNMRLWDQILPESVLKDLMLNKLLNARVMIILLNQSQTNPVHMLGKIADSLPESWFVDLSECLPELRSLSDLMLQTVDSICKDLSPEEPVIRSTVLKILQVLNRIRSFESIQTIAEKYNYQEMVYSQQLLNN